MHGPLYPDTLYEWSVISGYIIWMIRYIRLCWLQYHPGWWRLRIKMARVFDRLEWMLTAADRIITTPNSSSSNIHHTPTSHVTHNTHSQLPRNSRPQWSFYTDNVHNFTVNNVFITNTILILLQTNLDIPPRLACPDFLVILFTRFTTSIYHQTRYIAILFIPKLYIPQTRHTANLDIQPTFAMSEEQGGIPGLTV